MDENRHFTDVSDENEKVEPYSPHRINMSFCIADENKLQTIIEYARALASGAGGIAIQAGEEVMAAACRELVTTAQYASWSKQALGLLRLPEGQTLTTAALHFKKYGMCKVPLSLWVSGRLTDPVEDWVRFDMNLWIVCPNADSGRWLLRWRWPWEDHISQWEGSSVIVTRTPHGWQLPALPGSREGVMANGQSSDLEAERGCAFEMGAIGGGIIEVWEGAQRLASTNEPPYAQFKLVWVGFGTTITLKAIPIDDRHVFEYWLYNGAAVTKPAEHQVYIGGPGNQFVATFYREE